MKLYLTSNAANVLEKIVPLLNKSPHLLKVAFIQTAADIYENSPWIDNDKNKLNELGFSIKIVDLKDKESVEKSLKDVDIIFVAGGNTSYLLEQAQKCDFLEIVRNLVKHGVIYIGSSAGSLLAGPNIEIDKIYDDGDFGKELNSYEGLGFIDFVILPHADNPAYEPYIKKIFEKYGDKYKFKKLNDNQFIIVEDNNNQIVEV
jgi:dipeptidase E